MNTKIRSKYRAQYLGFIFQAYNLIPELSVFENVEVPLLISGAKRADYSDRVHQVIADVGLSDHIKHRPGELSGGQQQRVSIARALVKQPPLIIADEPTANLDSKTGQGIMTLMADLNKGTSKNPAPIRARSFPWGSRKRTPSFRLRKGKNPQISEGIGWPFPRIPPVFALFRLHAKEKSHRRESPWVFRGAPRVVDSHSSLSGSLQQ